MKVKIFGAGISGLSAAHALVELGHEVSVYEALDQPGGFFRSARVQQSNMPTEYSWHGMGPWYNNTFDVMRKIPFKDGNIFDLALSLPIDFGVFPDNAQAQFFNKRLRNIPHMFRMSRWEFCKWSYLMAKTWTSRRRSERKYSGLNAAEAWRPLLKKTAYNTWRSCFGPWIGSDWSKVCLHTTGDFFRKQLLTRGTHQHHGGHTSTSWMHGAGDGWLLFKGPSSEYWFQPWIAHLKQKGVKFCWQNPLTELQYDGSTITSAVTLDETVSGDCYILAINPFSTAEILTKTPALEKQEVLRLFKGLVQDGPHTQVSFRLGFMDEIKFPRERVAVVVSDSEFNLTLFATEQVWDKSITLGNGIRSLWTGTSCISTVPGRIHGRPVRYCTKEEFIEEIKAQIFDCGALDELVQEANSGKRLRDFRLVEVEVWHEWEFSREGIKHLQPKWVNSTNTHNYMPPQTTPVANLFLAGSHTRTQAHVWSIEAAVESGRRAAKAIDQRVTVIDQRLPGYIKMLAKIDDLLYAVKAPQLIDVILIAGSAMMLWLCLDYIFW